MKKTPPPTMNYAWSEMFIRELERLGIKNYYIAPGSRSSPLALSALEFGSKVRVHVDERGVGFAALGYARATGNPAAIITTSGSAAANLWPAVCEASMDAIPMLIITADRPPELRDTGANQTMDQVKLFGGYARWFFDLPCPDTEIPAAFLLGTIDHAVARCRHGHPGPVHLNQMFREPLAPGRGKHAVVTWQQAAGHWWHSNTPWTVYPEPSATDDLKSIAGVIAKARRGIVVGGSTRMASDSKIMLGVAEELGWPLLPDIRSGLRLGGEHSHIVYMADQILLSENLAAELAPDVILHLGGRITSKRIQHFINRSPAKIIVVNEDPSRQDPEHRVSLRVIAKPSVFPCPNKTPSSWRNKWKRADATAQAAWDDYQRRHPHLTEPFVAACVSRQLPPSHGLILGNSMPVRDMEMYGERRPYQVAVDCNRGMSGIDGNIATAVGFAEGLRRPVTLVIGDLAFLHDSNSLALVRRSEYPLVIVVINNDGGGIFSFLPVAGATRHFESCFGAPHGMEFGHAAAQYDLAYSRPKTPDEFSKTYGDWVDSSRRGIIEVQTDRAENLREHRRIQATIRSQLDPG
jgi:2-succinyl-5-enolpyruvyl-6-hydroxy-3-cyclohexene-1-carboxylate synthase